MTVEYAGGPFHGFQRQPGLATVQGELERAIGRITGAQAAIMGAGRTDAGVHALGQVAVFDLDGEIDIDRLLAGLNAVLPRGIAVAGMKEAREDFDPRREALWREYRYFVLNRRAPSPLLEDFTFHIPLELNEGRMAAACRLFHGAHDFSAFRVKGTELETTVREVLECDLSRPRDDVICFRVRANAFLYRMVRIMSGALTAVGRGKMSLEELESHLEGGDAPCADPLGAKGLFLWRVAYPGT